MLSNDLDRQVHATSDYGANGVHRTLRIVAGYTVDRRAGGMVVEFASLRQRPSNRRT